MLLRSQVRETDTEPLLPVGVRSSPVLNPNLQTQSPKPQSRTLIPYFELVFWRRIEPAVLGVTIRQKK